MFALDAINAHKGDALVVRWGPAGEHMLLVDGGPGKTYEPHLLPRLRDLAGQDHFGEQRQPRLRLVVVSHVDDDHIRGILHMLGDIKTALMTANDPPVHIDRVWHNSFDDLHFIPDFDDEPEFQSALETAAAELSSLEALVPAITNDPTTGPPPNGLRANALSVRQGRDLTNLLTQTGIKRNREFEDGFVRAGHVLDEDGLKLECLLPNQPFLDKLRTTWKSELKKILEPDARKARAKALALAFDDRSVPNQSSIVLHASYEGKSLLLTGDVRGDHLLTAIDDSDSDLDFVDIFKIPHHGSAHSNGEELFERVRANHYVFSGNGNHGNPHPDTIRALHKTQHGRKIAVYLTNDPLAGAKKSEDIQTAKETRKALAELDADPNVTLTVRDANTHAITVEI